MRCLLHIYNIQFYKLNENGVTLFSILSLLAKDRDKYLESNCKVLPEGWKL